MRLCLAMLAATILSPVAATAQVTPAEELMQPPADAQKWVFVSMTGKHGEQYRWVTDDGCVAFRESTDLRGWTGENDQLSCYGDHGMPVRVVIRGKTGFGPAEETFIVEDGVARWKNEKEDGSADFEGRRFYAPSTGPTIALGELVSAIKARPDGRLALLPSGEASITPASSITVEGPDGEKDIRLHYVNGYWAQPLPVWLNEDGSMFGAFIGLGLLPEGYEAAIPAIVRAQQAAGEAASRELSAKYLTEDARAPILFDNVTIFDAEARAFRDDMAVSVEDGIIARVGPAGSLTAASGTRVVDGTGKTLVPGLWDAHAHFGQDDWKLFQNISLGITNYRSPGAELPYALDKRERRAAGELLAPEMFVSAIVDQKHPLSAQGAITVESEAEAVEAVRKIHAAGLYGVKFYTSMNPDWIAPAAAEAQRLGLHVSGHVPATMLPIEAVRAGYDELTHLNFALMQFMPREVVDASNTAQRMEGPLRHARNVDLDSAEVEAFVAELAERGTIVDPTVALFEDLAVPPTDGSLPPSAAPYEGLFPATVERGQRTTGYVLLDGLTRDDYRASYTVMRDLIGKLHEGGVTLVAGTDGQGHELFREIEIYEQAGLSKAEALATATIIPAEVAGVADRTGSIEVGKEADLALVDGKVAEDLGALRRVETVVMDGIVIDAGQLRRDSGINGDPR